VSIEKSIQLRIFRLDIFDQTTIMNVLPERKKLWRNHSKLAMQRNSLPTRPAQRRLKG
jgi:hypothetical protein